MATHQFKAHRVTALPTTLEAYAIYYVASAAKPDYVEIYVTNSDGTQAKRVINEADVKALIDVALAGVNEIVVYDDIAERDAAEQAANKYAYVIDATADDTVTSGGATYIYDHARTAWVKTSEAESMDVVLDWSKIVNKPISTVAEIDAAVTNSHTHTNKAELDKIGEDAEGLLTYGGNVISSQWATVDW